MYIIYSHTCTFKHVHVQSYIQTCTCTKYHTFKYVDVQSYIQTCRCIVIHSNMYMYIIYNHTFKHVHVHNIQSYIQTYTCT